MGRIVSRVSAALRGERPLSTSPRHEALPSTTPSQLSRWRRLKVASFSATTRRASHDEVLFQPFSPDRRCTVGMSLREACLEEAFSSGSTVLIGLRFQAVPRDSRLTFVCTLSAKLIDRGQRRVTLEHMPNRPVRNSCARTSRTTIGELAITFGQVMCRPSGTSQCATAVEKRSPYPSSPHRYRARNSRQEPVNRS